MSQEDANFYGAALTQLGGLGCYWAGGNMGDGGFSARLTIEVLPNAQTAFTSAASALLATDDVHEGLVKSEPKWGSQSYSDCLSKDDNEGHCIFDILVSSYWLHIDEVPNQFSGHSYPFSAAQTSLLTAAVAAVTSLAAPGAVWPVPAASASLPTACASLTKAQVASVLGPSAKSGVDEGDGFATFDAAVTHCAFLGNCYWQGPYLGPTLTGIEVYTLPGSGWAWSASNPPKPDDGLTLTPLAGVGTAAFAGCSDEDGDCVLYAQVDYSWFEVEYTSSAATLAKTEALAQEIVAAAS